MFTFFCKSIPSKSLKLSINNCMEGIQRLIAFKRKIENVYF